MSTRELINFAEGLLEDIKDTDVQYVQFLTKDIDNVKEELSKLFNNDVVDWVNTNRLKDRLNSLLCNLEDFLYFFKLRDSEKVYFRNRINKVESLMRGKLLTIVDGRDKEDELTPDDLVVLTYYNQARLLLLKSYNVTYEFTKEDKELMLELSNYIESKGV